MRAHTERTVPAGCTGGQRTTVQQEARGTRTHRDDQRERTQGHTHLSVPGYGAHGQIGRFLILGRHGREYTYIISIQHNTK